MITYLNGIALKAQRISRGWTQLALAWEAGISERQLRRLESREWSRVYVRTLEALSRALNVPQDTLTYIQTPQPEQASRTAETKTRHWEIDAETSLRIPDLQRLPAFARVPLI